MIRVGPKISHSHKLRADLIQLQQLSISHRLEIEQRISYELLQNPALEYDEQLDLIEENDSIEGDVEWNENYGKPDDEYEIGHSPDFYSDFDVYDISEELELSAKRRFNQKPERLKKNLQAIDYFKMYGCLPDDADPYLHHNLETLKKSKTSHSLNASYPTFEVIVEEDLVEADVLGIGKQLKFVNGLGKYSTRSKNLIHTLHERNKLLSGFAHYILAIIQRDFFLQADLNTAVQYLIPLPTEQVLIQNYDSPFRIDKKYISKLGDHLVSCSFGIFPLNLFLPDKPQIIRLWVQLAQKEGKVKAKDQLNWIQHKIIERNKSWGPGDPRHKLIALLSDVSLDDIKNSAKKLKK